MNRYVEYKKNPCYHSISYLLNSFLRKNLKFEIIKIDKDWCLLLINEEDEEKFDKIGNKTH